MSICKDAGYLEEIKRSFYPVMDKIIYSEYINEFSLRAAASGYTVGYTCCSLPSLKKISIIIGYKL